jgi:hypothetical protein
MTDGRSKRKAKVIPFIDRVEKDRNENFVNLRNKAKLMKLEGFDNSSWNEDTWVFNSGRLLTQSGKNPLNASIHFKLNEKLGGFPLEGEWSEVSKSLFILRFHRKNQHVSEQRKFISAIGYISVSASELGLELAQLTPEVLDNACNKIVLHYAESSAYNLHKYVSEFAAHCDANGLCRVLLKYKYAKIKRPDTAGGIGYKRLDDPEVLKNRSDKLISPEVFKVIGELYLNVPNNHKYRFYVLMLVMLVCTGRRFSEISLLPNQELSLDDDGSVHLEYFPRKASKGDVFTPKKKLYLPTAVVSIVQDTLSELSSLTEQSRSTAIIMYERKSPNLSFLDDIPNDKKLFASELESLGISPTVLGSTGWIRKQGMSWPDENALTIKGFKPKSPIQYTNKEGVKKYCYRDFSIISLSPIHTDQFNKTYYLKDMLFIRPLGLSSGTYAHWLSSMCTQSMFTTFLRYFPSLAEEYAQSSVEVDFTSHHFRHTLNTLLDEGGLSDLLQTEWFGRTDPRDTKAYQHTSREKRALMLREDIKNGSVGGQLAEQIKVLPVDRQDAILKARVQAVHDVGTGICVHNFSQTPCERHLQCTADCKDYVWAKNDEGRLEDVKRQYALTALARENAVKQQKSNKPKKSADWIIHNDKKLKTLSKQLADGGVESFDPKKYLDGISND